jgi:hypothetical protein
MKMDWMDIMDEVDRHRSPRTGPAESLCHGLKPEAKMPSIAPRCQRGMLKARGIKKAGVGPQVPYKISPPWTLSRVPAFQARSAVNLSEQQGVGGGRCMDEVDKAQTNHAKHGQS